jgi:hypothetical protein
MEVGHSKMILQDKPTNFGPIPKINTLNLKSSSASDRQDNLPTPKKSVKFDTILIEIMNDSDKYYQFENFLVDEKNYDIDNLEFYIKVMEFKKETNIEQRNLAAGVIIDSFLTEEAEYYIAESIEGEQQVTEVIQTYELALT